MEIKVWAIVPARNVEKSIANTLRQLNRAGIHKTLVICNGCTDGTMREIQKTIPNLSMKVESLEITVPLGHDVPRAYGAIYAYRKKACTHLLFIDGDWSGSFGPMLESFAKEFFARKLDIMWTSFEKQIDCAHGYMAPWISARQEIPPELVHANPSAVPLAVSISTFTFLSPYWLHHPGKWFAYAIQLSAKGLHLGVNTLWDRRLTGHVLQDYSHNHKMKETLLGDAAEGSCILASKPFSRVYAGKAHFGFHNHRRTDLLLANLSTIQFADHTIDDG
jgi:hypothetical protein